MNFTGIGTCILNMKSYITGYNLYHMKGTAIAWNYRENFAVSSASSQPRDLGQTACPFLSLSLTSWLQPVSWGGMREANSPSGSLNGWDLPRPARPAHTHHAQVAQQPVAPGRLGEAAQPAAGDVEVPTEPQAPQQQVEEEEEQGEEEHGHGI